LLDLPSLVVECDAYIKKMMNRSPIRSSLNLAEIRARLAGQTGRMFWKSLEELTDSPAFQAYLTHEFPHLADPAALTMNRRDFLRFIAASLALAGLTACSREPQEDIVPYVYSPREELVAGLPLFFATASLLGGYATGILVRSDMGRPTKIEGNPLHPASLGATDIFAQASVLDLWDPDRSQTLKYRGRIATWDELLVVITARIDEFRRTQGGGLRILTETITSPTLAYQLKALLKRYPKAKWHQYEPLNRGNTLEGSRLAFGEPLEPRYDFTRADTVLSLDADFLGLFSGSVRYARDFTSRRQAETMNRLYAVESSPTLTGSFADHRLALPARDIEAVARLVARRLGINVKQSYAPVSEQWIAAVAHDLKPGASLVLAGDAQPPFVHALAHAMNATLGNIGTTVTYSDPVAANPINHIDSLKELIADLAQGNVTTLMILGGNPVFTAPADLKFSAWLRKASLSIHLGLYDDETAEACDWHIPEAHSLEEWSDARAFDGTVTVLQPLIAPLYHGHSAHELLAVLMGEPRASTYDIVRTYWQSQNRAPDFEVFWKKVLHEGLIEGSALPSKSVVLRHDFLSLKPLQPEPGLEFLFAPDPTLYDGRFANNGWLQELPKPLTKLTWDNAALISPALAERLNLANEEMVELRYRGRSVHAPIWITPGHPDNSVTVTLGYGRKHAGRLGSGTGFNAYALRTSDSLWFGGGLTIHKTGKHYPLAATQHHFRMEGRDILRVGTLAEYRTKPSFAQHVLPAASLYPEFKYKGYQWAMAINLNACIGCSACTLACQAENNIPIVGKEEVGRGREMHWIRVDRYYQGPPDTPDTYFQPVPCMHCERAPCEPVCPVEASVHDSEGLNVQVYNRCIGTRFCSNNCPYKVRRFNWLQYSSNIPSLMAQKNPEVTVRDRGVMEKCTYCVQRINAARIEAEKEGHRIRDGDVVTACQAACPTEAITFGDLNDPESRVRQLKASPLNYALLAELNTRPRTTYLAKLTNPNPEIEEVK
jgi:MoCo/4Fe-4S cofactor protein with predicted Tat translocation signal